MPLTQDANGMWTNSSASGIGGQRLNENFSSLGGRAPLSNLDALTDPSTTDDSSAGYNKGSAWHNTSTGQRWICFDPTVSAAVWLNDRIFISNLDLGGFDIINGAVANFSSFNGSSASLTNSFSLGADPNPFNFANKFHIYDSSATDLLGLINTDLIAYSFSALAPIFTINDNGVAGFAKISSNTTLVLDGPVFQVATTAVTRFQIGTTDSFLTVPLAGISIALDKTLKFTTKSLTPISGSVATDADEGHFFDIVLTSNITLTNPTNPSDGQRITWRFRQDSTGGRTVTLGSKFRLAAGDTSTVDPDPDATSYMSALYNQPEDTWDINA